MVTSSLQGRTNTNQWLTYTRSSSEINYLKTPHVLKQMLGIAEYIIQLSMYGVGFRMLSSTKWIATGYQTCFIWETHAR